MIYGSRPIFLLLMGLKYKAQYFKWGANSQHPASPMPTAATELATRIIRALLSASSRSSWTPCLERTLHRLVSPRGSLSPALVSRVIDQPPLQANPDLALGFFHWATQQPNFSHNALTYGSILRSLSLSRQYNSSIETLLKKVKAEKIGLDGLTYRCVVKSLVRGRKTRMAYRVFSDGKAPIGEIGAEVCNSLLAALSSDGYLEDAFKVFDEMRRGGVLFTTLGFGVLIWRFCRVCDLARLMSLLEEVKSVGGNGLEIDGSVVALMVVHGLCGASRVSEAMWVLNDLRIRGFKPDFMAYRVVAEGLRLKGGSLDDVHTVLRMKRKLGVAPRTADYRDVILCLIAARRLTEAKELGEIVVSGDFPIDDDALNALIGSVSSIDPSSGLMFFNYLIKKGKVPSLLTVNNMSRNLCKHGKFHELSEVYSILSSNGFFGDIERYGTIFSIFCEAGRVREAYGVLQEMKKKGLGPDIAMYNVLMESCCREDMLRPARRLWDEMFVTGCGVNLKTYNILIRKFCEIGEAEEAVRLFNHMVDKSVAPDTATYTSLLEGLCQELKFEAGLEIFDRAVKQDAALARSILRKFILNLCVKAQYHMASDLLCSLNEEVVDPDSHVVLLKYLADAQAFRVGLEHVKRLQRGSPSIWQRVSSELLASSSSDQDPILSMLQAGQCSIDFVGNPTSRATSAALPIPTCNSSY